MVVAVPQNDVVPRDAPLVFPLRWALRCASDRDQRSQSSRSPSCVQFVQTTTLPVGSSVRVVKPLPGHYIVRPLDPLRKDGFGEPCGQRQLPTFSRIGRRLRTTWRRCCASPASAPIRASEAKSAAPPSGWPTSSKLGLATELIETAGHPLVYAESPPVPGKPVALVYGHYDVQPPDPLDEWISPPFEPTVRDGNVYARGATDDKGQMLTHVKSVEAWLKAVGKLPLQVKFLIEGEEEVGSEHLAPFVRAEREKLACDTS